jgi:rod shape-determining protein MreC
VLLASDASSVVAVRLAPSGQIGWVTGQGGTGAETGLLRLQVLDKAAVLTPGEQLVTAASVHDRPFVPGVPVGTISAVQNRAGALTAVALVRPYAEFTALNVVGIVVAPPRRDPRYSVLPPRPSPAPAPVATPAHAAVPAGAARPAKTRRPGQVPAPSRT